MTLTEAHEYLKRAERSGYVAYHTGITHMITGVSESGRELGYWGINIDGDGHDGRLFGCPQIIWSADQAEQMFPSR